MSVLATNVENQQLFLQALRQMLPSVRQRNDAHLTKKIGKEKLDEISEEVFALIASSGCQNLTRNENLAMVCQLLSCLSRYITEALDLPVTLNTVISNIGMLEYAVDLSFPGYIRSGLLRYTILPKRSIA